MIKSIIITIFVALPLLYCIYKYFNPTIDTVISNEISVLLWYNKWEGHTYTRKYIKLFKIKKL